MFLVLPSSDIARLQRFYERLGYVFAAEQHGTGPVHATTVVPSMAVELYPSIAALADAPGPFIGAYVDDPIATKADLIENYGGREASPAIATSKAQTASLRDPGGMLVRLFRASPVGPA